VELTFKKHMSLLLLNLRCDMTTRSEASILAINNYLLWLSFLIHQDFPKRGFLIALSYYIIVIINDKILIIIINLSNKHQYETFHLPACLYNMYCPADVKLIPCRVMLAGKNMWNGDSSCENERQEIPACSRYSEHWRLHSSGNYTIKQETQLSPVNCATFQLKSCRTNAQKTALKKRAIGNWLFNILIMIKYPEHSSDNFQNLVKFSSMERTIILHTCTNTFNGSMSRTTRMNWY